MVSEIELIISTLLERLHLNLKDQNYKDTPKRVARMLVEDFKPLPFQWKVFEEQYDEMILLKNHVAYTRCPHHLERVRMKVSIGYIPDHYVIGLSKLPRLIDSCCKGTHLQEELTNTVADLLYNHVQATGVGVYIIGKHDCMQARGVKTNSEVTTSAFRGAMLNNPAARAEFFSLVKEA
jgi:GTP cyclohydrolase I